LGHPIQPNVKFVPHLKRGGTTGRRRNDWSDAKKTWMMSIARPAIYSVKYHAARNERLSKRYDEMHPKDKGHRGSIKKVRRRVSSGRAVHHKSRAATRRSGYPRSSAVRRRSKSNKPKRSRYSQLM